MATCFPPSAPRKRGTFHLVLKVFLICFQSSGVLGRSGWINTLLQSCQSVTRACRDQPQLVSMGFTACPHTFMFGCGEKHPDSKSCRELYQDKPRCTTSCRGDETNHAFLLEFYPQSPSLLTHPLVSYCWLGLASVKQPLLG